MALAPDAGATAALWDGYGPFEEFFMTDTGADLANPGPIGVNPGPIGETNLAITDGTNSGDGPRWLLVQYLPLAARSHSWFKRYARIGTVKSATFYGFGKGQMRWALAECQNATDAAALARELRGADFGAEQPLTTKVLEREEKEEIESKGVVENAKFPTRDDGKPSPETASTAIVAAPTATPAAAATTPAPAPASVTTLALVRGVEPPQKNQPEQGQNQKVTTNRTVPDARGGSSATVGSTSAGSAAPRGDDAATRSGPRWIVVKHLPAAAKGYTWFKAYEHASIAKVKSASFYGLREGQMRWALAECEDSMQAAVLARKLHGTDAGGERPLSARTVTEEERETLAQQGTAERWATSQLERPVGVVLKRARDTQAESLRDSGTHQGSTPTCSNGCEESRSKPHGRTKEDNGGTRSRSHSSAGRKGRHRFRGPGGRPRATKDWQHRHNTGASKGARQPHHRPKSREHGHGGDAEGRRKAGAAGSTSMGWRSAKSRRLNGDNCMGGVKGNCASEEEYSSYSEIDNSVRKSDAGRGPLALPAPSTADATVARQAVTSSIAADVAVGEAEVSVTMARARCEEAVRALQTAAWECLDAEDLARKARHMEEGARCLLQQAQHLRRHIELQGRMQALLPARRRKCLEG